MGCHESSPEVSEGQVEISDFPRDLTKLKSERENSIFVPGMRQKGTLIFPYGMKFNSPSILARLRGNALRKASDAWCAFGFLFERSIQWAQTKDRRVMVSAVCCSQLCFFCTSKNCGKMLSTKQSRNHVALNPEMMLTILCLARIVSARSRPHYELFHSQSRLLCVQCCDMHAQSTYYLFSGF